MFTADFVRFSALKLSRMAESFMDPGIIQACRNWNADVPSGKFMQVVANKPQVRKVYLVAPWHRNTYRILLSRIRDWNNTFGTAFLRLYGVQLHLEVSWKLAGRPLKVLLCRAGQ